METTTTDATEVRNYEYDINSKPPDGFGFIYKIRCDVTGEEYIGKTIKSLKERLKRHCKKNSCVRLYRAIQKYGKSNFSIEILGVFLEELLNEAEKAGIIDYGTLSPNGYNLTTGGEGGKVSAETLIKMSAWQKGVPKSIEHRKHLSDATTGSKHPQYGIKQTKEHIQKRVFKRRCNGSYILSEETKQRIGKASLGRKPWNKGTPLPPELIKKQRNARAKYHMRKALSEIAERYDATH